MKNNTSMEFRYIEPKKLKQIEEFFTEFYIVTNEKYVNYPIGNKNRSEKLESKANSRRVFYDPKPRKIRYLDVELISLISEIILKKLKNNQSIDEFFSMINLMIDSRKRNYMRFVLSNEIDNEYMNKEGKEKKNVKEKKEGKDVKDIKEVKEKEDIFLIKTIVYPIVLPNGSDDNSLNEINNYTNNKSFLESKTSFDYSRLDDKEYKFDLDQNQTGTQIGNDLSVSFSLINETRNLFQNMKNKQISRSQTKESKVFVIEKEEIDKKISKNSIKSKEKEEELSKNKNLNVNLDEKSVSEKKRVSHENVVRNNVLAKKNSIDI